MKKNFKEYYAENFPRVPDYLIDEALAIYNEYPGRDASDHVCFEIWNNKLIAHCIHIFSRDYGKYVPTSFYYGGHYILEQNRYIFSQKEGFCRFTNFRGEWRAVAFREPAFSLGVGVSFWANSYGVYTSHDGGAIQQFFKYVQLNDLPRANIMTVIKFLMKHPNAEYLAKQGFTELMVEEAENPIYVDWKSNNLKTMLGLNKLDIKAIQEHKIQKHYWKYKNIKSLYPQLSPCLICKAADMFLSGVELSNMLDKLNKHRNVSSKKLIEYFSEQHINRIDYNDYIRQCEELNYNLQDSMYMFPHNFHKMHQRRSELINVLRREQEEKKRSEESKLITQRASELEPLKFEHSGLMIVLPESTMDILNEGKALNHCVGGYAGRHANGKLSIVFLRKADKPDVPYYTIEVSNDFTIKQCRGFKNNVTIPKTDDVEEFEKAYQKHLDKLKAEKEKKSA